MYVSMIPKGKTDKVINCSQNDNENRKWEFELFDEKGVIDNVSDQIVFPARVGGTEEIVGEDTAPFLGDIAYPDETRLDQNFLDRQSPTTEDGNAEIIKIKGNSLVFNQLVNNATEGDAEIQSIKGNTISFNQLVQNGNFESTSGWSYLNVTQSASNNILTITKTASNGYGAYKEFHFSSNHKIYRRLDFKGVAGVNYRFNGFLPASDGTGNWKTISSLSVITDSTTYFNSSNTEQSDFQSYQLTNFICCDLTLMGIDNLTTVAEVEEWLSTHIGSLPYYGYTPGTLIPFMGTGLKTTGKNLFSGAESYSRDNEGYYIREGQTNNPLPLKLAKGTYTISIKSTVAGLSQLEFFSGGTAPADRVIAPYVSLVVGVKTYTFTIDKQSDYIRMYGSFVGTISDIQIEYGSTATDYEPYTSNTLSLPTLTYFPTGMKSAGSVYDELSDKAYTRVGSVDLGTLSWVLETSATGSNVFFGGNTIPLARPSAGNKANVLCAIYTTELSDSVYSGAVDKAVGISVSGVIRIRDTSFSDANTLKQSLSGVYLYYELPTPTETDISLDLTYPVWNGGTEQILPVNTSTPTTSPLKATIDYLDDVKDVEFLYKQTDVSSFPVTLVNGHSYIKKEGAWSAVSGTGQTINIARGQSMLIDLTKMGNAYITNYSQFEALYPDLYDYETGKLMSFTGTALKSLLNGEVVGEVSLPTMSGGWKSAGNVYDEQTETKRIKRVGVRAYQSGDENDNTLLTDGVNTNYPLETPIEEGIMSASLVCKGQEIPLTLDNGKLVAECNTSLSSESGKFLAKIKLEDGEGVCYSEELHLYVERKPQ